MRSAFMLEGHASSCPKLLDGPEPDELFYSTRAPPRSPFSRHFVCLVGNSILAAYHNARLSCFGAEASAVIPLNFFTSSSSLPM